MNSPSDARAAARRLPYRGVALALVLMAALGVVALASLLLAVEHLSGLGMLAALLSALVIAVLLLGAGGLGWHVGVRLTRQQLGEALREARMQVQVHSQLQPDWQWATDAGHHLVRWQAPQGALASSWVGNVATQALWERFALAQVPGAEPQAEHAGAHEGLSQLLQNHAAFADLQVRAADGGAGQWLLRGVPSWDGLGRFAGYQGTARPLAVAPPGPVPVAGTIATTATGTTGIGIGGLDTAWLDALPGPAWLLDECGLLAGNGRAAALMERPLVAGMAWQDCLTCLPPELAANLQSSRFERGSASYVLVSALAELGPPAVPDVSEHESFSYTVSHDLRAPLRVVEGFARILKEDYGRLLDRIGNDHLDRVMGAAARMNSMIDALLSLAQLSAQPLARQPVNLSQLASFVIEELRRGAPERPVEVQIQPQLVVQGDPTLLRMVLENLLSNAWKYSSKCAQAQIRFEGRQEKNGQWIYMVGDNGAGFDMRFADRLFGVFQRLHSASDFQGTGVGLASVRRIIRRHGGDIWAESEVGQGARFYFTLAG
ncbi:MAG: ATP-binding protein [Burkholderiaceae bacterium]